VTVVRPDKGQSTQIRNIRVDSQGFRDYLSTTLRACSFIPSREFVSNPPTALPTANDQ
jgi:hypothetical protein